MAIHYIHAVNGTGTGAGTALDPYQSWTEVPALGNGDTVRWARGMTHSYAGFITPGTLAANCTFEAYASLDGSDDPLLAKPVLVNSNGDHVFNIANTTNRHHMTIRNLVMRDSTNPTMRNLTIGTSDYTFISNILIEDCEFYNAALNNVRIFGAGVTVRRCILDECADDNIYTEGQFNNIYNNTLTRPLGDNIQIGASVHLTPNNYKIRNNQCNADGSVKQNIITVGADNEVIRNTCIAGVFGINLAAGTSNNKAYGNKIFSGSTTNRLINEQGTDNEVKGNLVVRTQAGSGADGNILSNNSANLQIDNNTIIDTGSRTNIEVQATATGATVRSNIIVGGAEGINRGAAAITESHNRFYGNAENYTLLGTPQVIDSTSEEWLTDQLDANYLPLKSSTAIGQGIKTWTGANIEGANGEPFSDFDIDIGGNQTTYGPFHPKNL